MHCVSLMVRTSDVDWNFEAAGRAGRPDQSLLGAPG
jgi:hypothetical protein